MNNRAYSLAGYDLEKKLPFLEKDMPLLHKFVKDIRKLDIRKIRQDLIKEFPRFKGLSVIDKLKVYRVSSDVEMPINELHYYLRIKETQSLIKFHPSRFNMEIVYKSP